MTRLTKTIRARMVKDLLERRFNEQGNSLAARSAELFSIVYDDHYDDESRKMIARLTKKHRGAFDCYSTIETRAGGMSISVGSSRIGLDVLWWRAEVTALPFLPCDRRGGVFSYVNCPISQQLEQFAQDQLSLTREIENARKELSGALDTVTTAKQLSELWPEAMPIIGKYIPVARGSNLPAVQFSRLTESFHLNVAKRENAA